MKKLKFLRFTVMVITFFLGACFMDSFPLIAVVKNNSASRILLVKKRDESITDSVLYNEQFSETWIDVNTSKGISERNLVLKSLPDSFRVYLYVFNCDSVDKYQKLKRVNGIFRSSFIKKIEIQLNRVKDPPDTIHIR